jgi:hypothetical protein
MTLAGESCQQRIDGAFGQLKSVVIGQELDELISVRFAQSLHCGQHTKLGQTLAELCAPLIDV